MLNEHVFFLVQILTVAFGEHALAVENASIRLDSPAAAAREENDAFTVSAICDFIEPMQYERVEATDYSVSFGVTSRLDSYLYRPTSLWHFSGQRGSTLTAMLNEHVFFLVQVDIRYHHHHYSLSVGNFGRELRVLLAAKSLHGNRQNVPSSTSAAKAPSSQPEPGHEREIDANLRCFQTRRE
ncbi:hypothetical protein HPB51_025410 [Rhipicephalus microplus]|uniref:Secreted protein n=1 Tax=Rhipicephalus microplus TaxID=6941 RepID=A0A9J6D7W4_RHIMP|nr:hypothetical protein HPB51_025410 [Rhipicephalus microplus]